MFNKALKILTLSSIVSASFIGPSLAGDINFEVEEPLANHVNSGISNLRGWAISTAGIDRVELYVDGGFITNIPSGGARGDVGAAFPQVSGALQSGFSMAFNYSVLADGEHTAHIKVIDNDGAVKEKTVPFSTVSFATAYIDDPQKIILDNGSVSVVGNAVMISNLMADGQDFDVRLEWNSEAQGLRFSQMALSGGGGNNSGQCVDIDFPANGSRIVWDLTGTQQGISVTGTVDTTYVSISDQSSNTHTLSDLTMLGSTSSSTSDTEQVYRIDNNLLYSRRIEVMATSVAAGMNIQTTSVSSFSPDWLVGPSGHYCAGFTWNSPPVTLTQSITGIPDVIEQTVEFDGVIESVNDVITVPAGTFTTVRIRRDRMDQTATIAWTDRDSGLLVKQEDYQAGALTQTIVAKTIQD